MNKVEPGLTRREVILGAGAIVAGASTSRERAWADGAAPALKLRLLGTSDLHMFVLDWDYFHAELDPTVGVAKVATLIAAARAENPNSLLFDNGDFLQGNPLGDYIAEQPAPTAASPHPLVSVFHQLGYDAVGLGNHEFNYGLPFLEATLAGSSFPFVCANITRIGGAPFLAPYAVIVRKLKDSNGAERELRMGVIGFVPPQIMVWDKSRLEGKIETRDIVATARHYVPELRARCDVVIALCHAGINSGPYVEGEENASFHLASVAGIDAIFTGHSHRVFPGSDFAGRGEGIDAVAGRLNGVPAAMPGFWGSHLAVIDLDLRLDGAGWRIEKAAVEARPIYRREAGKVETLATRDPVVAATIAPAHRATLAWVEQPVGRLDAPVHSYFVWAGYDPATAVVNAAQLAYARPLLAAGAHADLPVLSVAAPYRAGYTPDSFIDIAAGKVPLREVADLYVFGNNTVVAIKVTGGQIWEWLESSARVFAMVDVSRTSPQPLLDKFVPSYNFDIIAGVTYRIDPTQPVRYDAKGKLNASARRIVDLQFQGKPIDLAREFIVVANNYRTDGGGNFPALKDAQVVLRAPDANRDAVLRYFRAQSSVPVAKTFPWSFASSGHGVPVYFDTGKPALERLADAPGVIAMGEGEPGYARVGFTLG